MAYKRLSFAELKTFRQATQLSQKDFSIWLNTFIKSYYDAGYEEGVKDKECSITYETLKNAIRCTSGVGEELTNRIMEMVDICMNQNKKEYEERKKNEQNGQDV